MFRAWGTPHYVENCFSVVQSLGGGLRPCSTRPDFAPKNLARPEHILRLIAVGYSLPLAPWQDLLRVVLVCSSGMSSLVCYLWHALCSHWALAAWICFCGGRLLLEVPLADLLWTDYRILKYCQSVWCVWTACGPWALRALQRLRCTTRFSTRASVNRRRSL